MLELSKLLDQVKDKVRDITAAGLPQQHNGTASDQRNGIAPGQDNGTANPATGLVATPGAGVVKTEAVDTSSLPLPLPSSLPLPLPSSPNPSSLSSLSDACRSLLGQPLNKAEQLSNWNTRPLSSHQVQQYQTPCPNDSLSLPPSSCIL